MEIKELFYKEIEEIKSSIKLTENRKKSVEYEISNLRKNLRRKEKAKAIYFGEKQKNPKPKIKKSENKLEEAKDGNF